MPGENREIFRLLAVYGHIGASFVFSILIGFGIGWALDNKVFSGTTAPYLTLLFLAFGILAGFKGLWDVVRKLKDE